VTAVQPSEGLTGSVGAARSLSFGRGTGRAHDLRHHAMMQWHRCTRGQQVAAMAAALAVLLLVLVLGVGSFGSNGSGGTGNSAGPGTGGSSRLDQDLADLRDAVNR
jgi:hypothetical protein